MSAAGSPSERRPHRERDCTGKRKQRDLLLHAGANFRLPKQRHELLQELVFQQTDKLPRTQSRLELSTRWSRVDSGLLGRTAAVTLAGAMLGSEHREPRSKAVGALFAGVGAIVGNFGGYCARKSAAEAARSRDCLGRGCGHGRAARRRGAEPLTGSGVSSVIDCSEGALPCVSNKRRRGCAPTCLLEDSRKTRTGRGKTMALTLGEAARRTGRAKSSLRCAEFGPDCRPQERRRRMGSGRGFAPRHLSAARRCVQDFSDPAQWEE